MKKNLSISLNLNIPFSSGFRLVEIAGISKIDFKISNEVVESNDIADNRWKIVQPCVASRIIEVGVEGEIFGQMTDKFIRNSALNNSSIFMEIIFENNETMYGEFYIEDYVRKGTPDKGEVFFVHMRSSGAITDQNINKHESIGA